MSSEIEDILRRLLRYVQARLCGDGALPRPRRQSPATTHSQARDLMLINEFAGQLNAEAADVLEFQSASQSRIRP
jgi:hypothetical protein